MGTKRLLAWGLSALVSVCALAPAAVEAAMDIPERIIAPPEPGWPSRASQTRIRRSPFFDGENDAPIYGCDYGWELGWMRYGAGDWRTGWMAGPMADMLAATEGGLFTTPFHLDEKATGKPGPWCRYPSPPRDRRIHRQGGVAGNPFLMARKASEL